MKISFNKNPIGSTMLLAATAGLLWACSEEKNTEEVANNHSSTSSQSSVQEQGKQDGMVWIPGGDFMMGTDEQDAYPVERPAVKRHVEGFWMDETEVTNAAFKKFVDETGYVTIAEKKPEWECR